MVEYSQNNTGISFWRKNDLFSEACQTAPQELATGFSVDDGIVDNYETVSESASVTSDVPSLASGVVTNSEAYMLLDIFIQNLAFAHRQTIDHAESIVLSYDSAYPLITGLSNDSRVNTPLRQRLPKDNYRIMQTIVRSLNHPDDLMPLAMTLREVLKPLFKDVVDTLESFDAMADLSKMDENKNGLYKKAGYLLRLLNQGLFVFGELAKGNTEQQSAGPNASFLREAVLKLNQIATQYLPVNTIISPVIEMAVASFTGGGDESGEKAKEFYRRYQNGDQAVIDDLMLSAEVKAKLKKYQTRYNVVSEVIAAKDHAKRDDVLWLRKLCSEDRVKEAQEFRMIWSDPTTERYEDCRELVEELYFHAICEPYNVKEEYLITLQMGKPILKSDSAINEAHYVRKNILNDNAKSNNAETVGVISYGLLSKKFPRGERYYGPYLVDETNVGAGMLMDKITQSYARLTETYVKDNRRRTKADEELFFTYACQAYWNIINRSDPKIVTSNAARIRGLYQKAGASTNMRAELFKVYLQSTLFINSEEEAAAGCDLIKASFDPDILDSLIVPLSDPKNDGEKAAQKKIYDVRGAETNKIHAYLALSNNLSEAKCGIEAAYLRIMFGDYVDGGGTWYEDSSPHHDMFFPVYRYYLTKLNPLDAAVEAKAHNEIIISYANQAHMNFNDALSAYQETLNRMIGYERAKISDGEMVTLQENINQQASFIRTNLIANQELKIKREGFALYAILAKLVSQDEARQAGAFFREEIVQGSCFDKTCAVPVYQDLADKLEPAEIYEGIKVIRQEIFAVPTPDLRSKLLIAYENLFERLQPGAQSGEVANLRTVLGHPNGMIRRMARDVYLICLGNMDDTLMQAESNQLVQNTMKDNLYTAQASLDLCEVMLDNMTDENREQMGLGLVDVIGVRHTELSQRIFALFEKTVQGLSDDKLVAIADRLRIKVMSSQGAPAHNLCQLYGTVFFMLDANGQEAEAVKLREWFFIPTSEQRKTIIETYGAWLLTLDDEALKQQAEGLRLSLNEENQAIWSAIENCYKKFLLPKMSQEGLGRDAGILRELAMDLEQSELAQNRVFELYRSSLARLEGYFALQETEALRRIMQAPKNVLVRQKVRIAYEDLVGHFDASMINQEMGLLRETLFGAPTKDVRLLGVYLYGVLLSQQKTTTEEKQRGLIALEMLSRDSEGQVRQEANRVLAEIMKG